MRILILLSLLIYTEPCFGQTLKKIQKENIIKCDSTPKRDLYLYVSTGKNFIESLSMDSVEKIWGVGSYSFYLRQRDSSIEKIIMFNRGSKYTFPISSYIDLADINKIAVSSCNYKNGFDFSINGGDASTSYDAIFKMKKNRLISRKVSSGEFPNTVFDKTTYSRIPADSDM